MLILNFLAALLIFAGQGTDQVSEARKKEFIELLRALPTKGEFYTDEAVVTAGPYLPTLLALTKEDIEKYDIYPFAAISRGLCNHPEHRTYVVRNFAKIRHPELKLFWAAMLFDSGVATPEIKKFLRDALESKEDAKLLSEMLGPAFESFRKRIRPNLDCRNANEYRLVVVENPNRKKDSDPVNPKDLNIVVRQVVLSKIELPKESEAKNFSLNAVEKTETGFEINVNWGGGLYHYEIQFNFRCKANNFYLYQVKKVSFSTTNPDSGNLQDKKVSKVTKIQPNLPIQKFVMTKYL